MIRLSATIKGLITGLLMIGISLGIYYSRGNFQNNLQYITYLLYIAGIVYSLYSYQKHSRQNSSFKNYFSEGFKCFIVVTLLMVAFTWIFLKTHPALKDQMAQGYRTELLSKGDHTPAEVDDMVLKAKQYFITMFTAMAIFGYLIIGALVSVIGAVFFSQQDNAQVRREAARAHAAEKK